ncbi:MAG: DUF1616 domain-containing protein [Dehalococcoidales bacterium]|nr:DUF1616 domain-containing protein [Dehalococcoidales bacterium]
MTIKVRNELILLNLLVVVLIGVIALFPTSVLRVILGLPFLFFLPGYALVAALFTRKGSIGTAERLALSFGVSVAVVPLIGLAINYTPWGIKLESALYSIALLTVVASVVAWWRRQRLPETERFGIELRLRVPGWGGGTWDKVVTSVLAVVIVGTLGTLGYVAVAPKVGERFTEFYILGLDGRAIDYPQRLVVGEAGKVVVGIVNQEQETVSYQVEVVIDGVPDSETGPVVLDHDGRWEETLGFTPDKVGEGQKVEFRLYRQGTSGIYRQLQLWIDVQ